MLTLTGFIEEDEPDIIQVNLSNTETRSR